MINYYEMFQEYLQEYQPEGFLQNIGFEMMKNGGHRIRPQLVLAWCEAYGGNAEDALPLALAVELVHTMSLIHDDLPCMDDGDMRHGKECLHKTNGEATAILCGDNLLAEAFHVITNSGLSVVQKMEAVKVLSQAAKDMADGQHMESNSKMTTVEEWSNVHKLKTASLLEAACKLGAVAASRRVQDTTTATRYGHCLGMAYQLMDDLRDGDGICTVIPATQVKAIASTYIKGCRGSQFLTDLARQVLTP